MATKIRSRGGAARSNVLEVERDVLTGSDPKAIAQALKHAAEGRTRPKSTPFRSAMSMLTLYINRAGAELDPGQRAILEAAKVELRALYGQSAAA